MCDTIISGLGLELGLVKVKVGVLHTGSTSGQIHTNSTSGVHTVWSAHSQHILPDPESNLAFELKGNENKDQHVMFTSYLLSLIFIPEAQSSMKM